MATHRLDPGAVQRLLTARNGGVARDMARRGRRVADEARRTAPVDTTRLRDSIRVRPLPPPHQPGVEVGTDAPYARHVIRGHGVIVPVRKKVLRFKPRGSQRFVFARRVKAVGPNRFLQRALRRGARG